jgi:hypothetical protein
MFLIIILVKLVEKNHLSFKKKKNFARAKICFAQARSRKIFANFLSNIIAN